MICTKTATVLADTDKLMSNVSYSKKFLSSRRQEHQGYR